MHESLQGNMPSSDNLSYGLLFPYAYCISCNPGDCNRKLCLFVNYCDIERREKLQLGTKFRIYSRCHSTIDINVLSCSIRSYQFSKTQISIKLSRRILLTYYKQHLAFSQCSVKRLASQGPGKYKSVFVYASDHILNTVLNHPLSTLKKLRILPTVSC